MTFFHDVVERRHLAGSRVVMIGLDNAGFEYVEPADIQKFT